MKKILALGMASLIVFVAISISAGAYVQQQRPIPQQGSSRGFLSGTVLGSNDEPLEGALVRIFGGHLNLQDLKFAVVLDKNYSNAEGMYSLDVASGRYTMLVTKDGYWSAFRFTVISPGEPQVENFNLKNLLPSILKKRFLNRTKRTQNTI